MIPIEIERKFLIEQTDALKEHINQSTDIVQTYLLRAEPELQRRVRSMCTDGVINYYYTEKRFISPLVREENERIISQAEYNALLEETDNSLKTIYKTRSILVYDGQRFEIDSYPFDDRLAVMELELENVQQVIKLPPFVSVLKEITGHSEYSNANLALNGRFPE